MQLNYDLLSQYINQMKEHARKKLSGVYSIDRSDDELSTVMASWIMYSMETEKLTAAKVIELLKDDAKQRGSMVGTDIFFTSKSDSYQKEDELCKAGLDVIAKAWPDLTKLIQVIEPRIVKLRSDMEAIDGDYESSSGQTMFGHIYFTMNRTNPMGWAEIVAHEVGHHYLFAIFSAYHRSINAPWKESFYSAIRKTNRPLIGVFHGVVAESFMIYLAYKVLCRPDLSSLHGEARELFQRQADRFKVDFATVSQFGACKIEETIDEITSSVAEIVNE